MEEKQLSRSLFAIAAMAKNRVIGFENKIPWHISEDFKFFKATTMNAVLLMGRKTYESIGRPLPGRITVVLSRTMSEENLPENVFVIRELAELDKIAPEKQVFLAGGGNLYRDFLHLCEKLYLTIVDMEPKGDAFFPEYHNYFDKGTIVASGDSYVIYSFAKNNKS